MSSPDDQLCLNITTGVPSPPKTRPLTGQERWLWKKKQKAEKRKLFSSAEVPQGTSYKQRRLGHLDRGRREEEEKEKEKEVPTRQSKARQEAMRGEEKRENRKNSREERERDRGRDGGGGGFIKTSSLFNHNPDIPEIQSPLVSQVKEKVFTSDSFTDLDLHPHLVATLSKVLNVSTMTSVQKRAIPVLLSGRDAVIRSQTGSGKTLSYGIPVVQSLQAIQPRVSRGDGPLALVVVPTRELAQQSFQTFQKLVKPFTWIVPGVLMGGEKRKSEKARLRKGINILVSTPGRLVDHIRNTLSITLTSVRWLILDEADRTLDLGFEKDLNVVLNCLNSTRAQRQNVLLSATITQGLSQLTDVCMNDPVSIQVSDPAPSDISTRTSDPKPASQLESFVVPEALNQYVVIVPSKLRLVCLAAFILAKCKFSQGGKLIVFVSSCEAVEFLLTLFTSVLCRPSTNHNTPLHFLRLHGNMKQEERTEVFEEFAVSQTGILLCTDVAARGLDLPQVTWIIQYTPPSTVEDYVHRVGRTARIGAAGNSLLFLTPAETTYITELANHNISLSDMKLLDILSNLMLDDTYKGRGKYYSKTSRSAHEQEVRERATVLQTEFENVVHTNKDTVQAAKKALQSFLRAYTAYPAVLKHIFHIRSLHLGHAAKSFGLRDAPKGLSASRGPGAKSQHKAEEQRPERRLTVKQRESNLLCSEFSSGMEGGNAKKKRQKKRKTTV
ncbi:ATP-dependent DNA helicase DDX31 isoform 2-T2 [Polymixia lowei]